MFGHLKGGEELLLKPRGMLGIYRHVSNDVFVQSLLLHKNRALTVITQEQSSQTADVHLLSVFTC